MNLSKLKPSGAFFGERTKPNFSIFTLRNWALFYCIFLIIVNPYSLMLTKEGKRTSKDMGIALYSFLSDVLPTSFTWTCFFYHGVSVLCSITCNTFGSIAFINCSVD